MEFLALGADRAVGVRGFSAADATYGVDHAGANWNAEAAEGAAWHMQSLPYTREALRAELAADGFTPSQVEFGLRSVGY